MIKELKDGERKALISTLWIASMLAMLIRDVHEFVRSGYLAEILDSEVSDTTLFISAFFVSIPIVMAVLARVLKRRIARPLTTTAAALWIIGVVGFNLTPDMDDVVFALLQVACMVAVVVVAVKWPVTEPASP